MSVRLSLVWTYLSVVLTFAANFGSTILLARLLNPHDFGIFAMANAVATIINILMQFGLAKYVTREDDLSIDKLRAVFTVNVFMSIAYSASILIGAAASGIIFESAEVQHFLLVFAIFPLLAMMEFIPAAICAREMRFGTISIMTVVRAVSVAVLSVGFAYAGFAYMSFAWAQVLSWAITATIYNVIVWRPDVWRFRLQGAKTILRFGAHIIGTTGVRELSTRAGEVVLGSILGLATLGLYTRASSLAANVYSYTFGASSGVIFSKLSRDLREKGTFHETYLHFTRLLLGIVWPLLFGLATLSNPVIVTLYGEKWQAAAMPLAILAVAYALIAGIGLASELCILRHQTGRQVKIETARSTVGFVSFAGGSLSNLSVAASGKVIESVVALFLYRKIYGELVGAPKGALTRVYREGLLLSLAAVGPSFALMLFTGFSEATPLLWIGSSVALGILLWSVALIRADHPLFAEVRRFFRERSRRVKGADQIG